MTKPNDETFSAMDGEGQVIVTSDYDEKNLVVAISEGDEGSVSEVTLSPYQVEKLIDWLQKWVAG
jgi:hypothetical protein